MARRTGLAWCSVVGVCAWTGCSSDVPEAVTADVSSRPSTSPMECLQSSLPVYPPSGASASTGEHLYLGTRTALAHWDGSRWAQVLMPSDPLAIWASSPEHVFVADSYSLLHSDGATLHEQLRLPECTQIEAVWGANATAVWAVGYTHACCADCTEPPRVAIYHFDGSAWLRVPFDTTGILRAVWGSGADDVWVSGTILARFDGLQWQQLPLEGPGVELELIGRNSAQWARSSEGRVFRFDGSVWSAAPVSNADWQVAEVLEIADGKAFAGAVASDGGTTVLEWDGSAFQVAGALAGPDSGQLRLGTLAGDVLAIRGASIDRLHAGSWSRWLDIADTGNALDIWADSAERAVLLRDTALLVRDSSPWKIAATPERRAVMWEALAARATNDAWIVGLRYSAGEPVVFHWDGTVLTPAMLPNDGSLRPFDAYWSDDGSVWITGQDLPLEGQTDVTDHRSRVLRLDTGSWQDVSPPGLNVPMSHATGAEGVVFVGSYEGKALRYADGTFTDLSLPSASLIDLYAADAASLYAIVGESGYGRVLHWGGVGWSEVSDLAGPMWHRIAGRGSDDVWVVGRSSEGSAGHVAHFDGAKWSISVLKDSQLADMVSGANAVEALPNGGLLGGAWLLTCLP